MNKRFRNWLGILLLSVSVMLAAGCQAIGGVDLNQALLKNFDYKSMESSGTVTVEFTPTSSKADTSSAEVMKAINPLKLHFDSIKTESRDLMSVKGSLEIPRGTIPFTASITSEELALQVEGADKPFLVKLSELSLPSGSSMFIGGIPGAMEGGSKASSDPAYKELRTKLKDPAVIKPFYSYLVKNLPNPENIKLSDANETINGQSVSLFKVHTELNGKELMPWAKSLVLRLMQDDQGLKDAISPLYDAAKPVLDQAVEKSGQDGEYDSFMGFFQPLLSDKETAVEVLHTEAKQGLVFLMGALNQADKAGSKLLSEDNLFKADIYVDKDLNIRKTAMELTLNLPKSMSEGGIAGVKVTSEFSNWNLDQPVKADVISTSGAVNLNEVSGAGDVLKHLDTQSVLYGFLKKDLHVTRKNGYFFIPEIRNPAVGAEPSGYYEQDTAMIRARNLARRLDLGIQWNDADQTVTLTSKSSGTTLKMKVGSTDAEISGKASTAPVPAVMQGNSVYVPLRYAVEMLGGKITYDEKSHMIEATIE